MPDGAIARARRLLRAEGAYGLWMHALAATVYRRLVVFEREVEDTEPPNPLGLATGLLGPAGLDEYEMLRPGNREIAQRRFASGVCCFAARLDGELVSVRWLAVGEAPVDFLGARLPLAADEVYVFDTYTAPERRGEGIAQAGLLQLFRMIAQEGRSRAVCAVFPANTAALRNVVKAGFVPAGRLSRWRLGHWRHVFVRRHSPRRTA